ncbi:hypothetical protein LX73_2361 [Fodinibius salinus]|uniref:Uncharacterized protein n=1 Tax=Fodinibius salinus TaxID=860790 RepID=A0A5D3YG96_9BACT|nr:hypothetical protein [Fodinibius salinus]TYP92111.1 hypothetical protein LX73_2361 [Fodinibius salinus]
MNRLRLHIIRLVIILFVGVGFGFSILQPAQAADTSTAFADWLRTKAKSGDNIKLEKELNNLRKSERHIDKVIEEASQIVRQNNKAFAFSFLRSAASDKVYQLLLIEWNYFQTGNGMSAVSTSPFPKSLFSGKEHLSLSHVDSFIARRAVFFQPAVGSFINTYSDHEQSLTPMANSIAIGAP